MITPLYVAMSDYCVFVLSVLNILEYILLCKIIVTNKPLKSYVHCIIINIEPKGIRVFRLSF